MKEYLQESGLDNISAQRILDSTWRKGTVQLYTTYIRKWQLFCSENDITPRAPTVPQVVSFLRSLEDKGLGYGAVNTARCALSVILPRINGETIGKQQMVQWFVRAVYIRNPPRSKYNQFWDVAIMFDYLRSLQENVHLSLMLLTFKLVILLLLVSGHRGQTLVALSLNKALISKDEIVFEMDTLLKSNRLGDPLSTLQLLSYPREKKLCVVTTIRDYISKTACLRTSQKLLVSYIKPHAAISRDTLARWTLRILRLAGVNTQHYAPHSTRGAMVSKARQLGISVRKILVHAGWKTQKAFAKHYNKKVEKRSKIAETLIQGK